MNLNDFIKVLETKEIELENKQKDAIAKRQESELRFQNQKIDFENKVSEFRIKIFTGLRIIAEKSNGTFKFRELPEHIVYHNDSDAENERIRNEFKYDSDNKEELLFDFDITTRKNNSFDLTLNIFNLDDKFSVLFEVSDYNKMEEQLYDYDTFINLDFEKTLFESLIRLNSKELPLITRVSLRAEHEQ